MRVVFIALVVMDLMLVAVDVLSYPAFLGQRASLSYLVAPVVLLVCYAAAALIAPRVTTERLPTAALVGLAAGGLEVVDIAVETFTGLGIAVTAPLMFGSFAVWGVVAAWTARATGAFRSGVAAAVCTAMITMLVAVAFGLVLAVVAPDRMTTIMATDPDFLRSGWTDVHAFVLANTFDAAFTHLLGALFVGFAVGLVGAMVGQRFTRVRQQQ